jgi:hypothetical protein
MGLVIFCNINKFEANQLRDVIICLTKFERLNIV